jgi:hypothetical protein
VDFAMTAISQAEHADLIEKARAAFDKAAKT